MGFAHKLLVLQRFRLEQASKADPLTLLKEITQNGISQHVCVNDLGMHIPQ
jgi:4-diphosphocytidyl-2-C-methyl-D-erythritol kinase